MKEMLIIYAVALLVIFITLIVIALVATRRNKAKSSHPIIIDENGDEFV